MMCLGNSNVPKELINKWGKEKVKLNPQWAKNNPHVKLITL